MNMHTHSFTDPNSGLREQQKINDYFDFEYHRGKKVYPGDVAKCKKHSITRCQACTHTALEGGFVKV